jgi:hypothetical protein
MKPADPCPLRSRPARGRTQACTPRHAPAPHPQATAEKDPVFCIVGDGSTPFMPRSRIACPSCSRSTRNLSSACVRRPLRAEAAQIGGVASRADSSVRESPEFELLRFPPGQSRPEAAIGGYSGCRIAKWSRQALTLAAPTRVDENFPRPAPPAPPRRRAPPPTPADAPPPAPPAPRRSRTPPGSASSTTPRTAPDRGVRTPWP